MPTDPELRAQLEHLILALAKISVELGHLADELTMMLERERRPTIFSRRGPKAPKEPTP